VLFGLEDRADELIEQMLNDTEPYIRYGGCLALAMAYVGTGSNKVIEKLLQQAVNDVADEVRRVAVISLAFVLFRNYE
jgi:26S proteasome regulatory subunit N2